MTPQEVQALRPGPYIIYFHPDKPKGYGVFREDRHGSRIEEQGLDPSKFTRVEEHQCIEEVSRRERELQSSHGFEPDTHPYWLLMLFQIRATTGQALKKRRKTQSKQRKGVTPDWWSNEEITSRRAEILSSKMKGVYQEHFNRYNEERKEPVAAFSDGLKVNEFDSLSEAAKHCGLKSGCSIWNALNGKSKTAGGYTWKYLNK